MGFSSLIERFNTIGDFLHISADIICAIVISQFIYILCRKTGSKATASGRLWIFIGISVLLIILYAITACIVIFPLSAPEALKLISNMPIDGAYVIPNAFIVLLFIFLLLIFNMIFYKITKEISFVIRNKNRNRPVK